MNPELTYVLQGAAAVAGLAIFCKIAYEFFLEQNADEIAIGDTLQDMQLVDLILHLNIVDASDKLIDIAHDTPSAFVRMGAVASTCMFYCDEVHYEKVGAGGTRVRSRVGDNEVVIVHTNSTRATIEACARALREAKRNGNV